MPYICKYWECDAMRNCKAWAHLIHTDIMPYDVLGKLQLEWKLDCMNTEGDRWRQRRSASEYSSKNFSIGFLLLECFMKMKPRSRKLWYESRAAQWPDRSQYRAAHDPRLLQVQLLEAGIAKTSEMHWCDWSRDSSTIIFILIVGNVLVLLLCVFGHFIRFFLCLWSFYFSFNFDILVQQLIENLPWRLDEIH